MTAINSTGPSGFGMWAWKSAESSRTLSSRLSRRHGENSGAAFRGGWPSDTMPVGRDGGPPPLRGLSRHSGGEHDREGQPAASIGDAHPHGFSPFNCGAGGEGFRPQLGTDRTRPGRSTRTHPSIREVAGGRGGAPTLETLHAASSGTTMAVSSNAERGGWRKEKRKVDFIKNSSKKNTYISQRYTESMAPPTGLAGARGSGQHPGALSPRGRRFQMRRITVRSSCIVRCLGTLTANRTGAGAFTERGPTALLFATTA